MKSFSSPWPQAWRCRATGPGRRSGRAGRGLFRLALSGAVDEVPLCGGDG